MTMRESNTKFMILCAMFAALAAVGAAISIPLPFSPVPVTFATLAIMLAGGLLGPKYGVISTCIYILLGAIGLPVFANFTGGIGILAGPTGGFIAGYPFIALLNGLLTPIAQKRSSGKALPLLVIFSYVASLVCYIPGIAWFMISTGNGFGSAMMMCFLPFIIGDILKAVVCGLMLRRLRSYKL